MFLYNNSQLIQPKRKQPVLVCGIGTKAHSLQVSAPIPHRDIGIGASKNFIEFCQESRKLPMSDIDVFLLHTDSHIFINTRHKCQHKQSLDSLLLQVLYKNNIIYNMLLYIEIDR